MKKSKSIYTLQQKHTKREKEKKQRITQSSAERRAAKTSCKLALFFNSNFFFWLAFAVQRAETR